MEKMATMLAERLYEEGSFPTVSYEAFKYVIGSLLKWRQASLQVLS